MINQYFKHNTHKNRWINIFLFLSILFALIEWASKAGIKSVAYGLFALGVLLLITKVRWGILFYISVFLLSTDTPSIAETESLVSIYTISFGGFSIMVIWTLVVLVILLFVFVYKGSFFDLKKNSFDKGLIYIGGLFAGAAIIGVLNLTQNPRIYISDASYFINMAVAYFAVRVFFRREEKLNTLVIFIISCIGVRVTAGLIYYLLGIGSIAPHIVKPVMDSSRNLFHFLPLLGIAVFYFRGIQRSTKYLFLVFAIVGTLNVLFYASRGNLILLGVSIFILALLLRQPGRRKSEVFRKTKRIFFPVTVLILTSILIMHYYRPGSLNYVWWKIRSTVGIDSPREISAPGVRLLEAKNIAIHLWDKGTIIWGQGLGGWFSDKYIPYATKLFGGNAYPDEWILQSKFFKPHGSQLVIFLKMGLLGVILYFGTLFWMFLKGWKLSRNVSQIYWRSICSASVVFLLTLYIKNFTSKLQIFLGILLAVIANIMFLYKSEKKSTYWKSKSHDTSGIDNLTD